MTERGAARLRSVPQLQRLLEAPEAALLLQRFSHRAVTVQLRAVLGEVRAALMDPDGPDEAPHAADLLARAGAALTAAAAPGLRRVINATGIILHTNLGRAPLPPEAAAAVAAVAHGYCNIEFDLEAGARGARTHAVEPLLQALTGAEAAVVVNNNAAAMLLALSALAEGGEVLVSRGELVEIGGGFRIPDVIRQGGARLVEVGATNKTRLDDYRRAITPATRVLLKVHQSNFQIVGFTETTPLPALSALAREAGLLLVDDLGSGALTDLTRLGRPAEATVQDSLAAGTDVVAFSGDKLMGGPQAGLLVGRAAAVDRLRRHPLMRALRLDKLSLAALEATLRLHRDRGAAAVPMLRMLGQSEAVLQDRAARLVALLGPLATVQATAGMTGGGAVPGQAIASRAVRLSLPDHSPDQLARRLRLHRPAIVGRIAEGSLLLDMLAVSDDEVPEIAAAVAVIRADQAPCAGCRLAGADVADAVGS